MIVLVFLVTFWQSLSSNYSLSKAAWSKFSDVINMLMSLQVFLCFGNSVASTRFLLQDEFNIQTTQCDNCIIVLSFSLSLCVYISSLLVYICLNMFLPDMQGFMFCLQQIACIFSIVAMIVGSDEIREASQLLNCLADMVYCT